MIFVTGANGLLGSKICNMLVENKQQVLALVRKNSDLSLLEKIRDNITICYGDILFPEEFEERLNEVDTIIHCAAVVSFHKSDKELMETVNVNGTSNMVNLALRKGINYFVHVSSVAAIGRMAMAGTVTENDTWQHSNLNSNYAKSKYLAELEVWRGIEEGMNAVIINPSVIISSDDLTRSSGQLFNYILDENKFYPTGSINYVDIRDVLNVIGKLLNQRKTNERYILNGGLVKYKTLFEEIAKRLNKKPPSIKSNDLLVKVGLLLERVKCFFSGNKPLITKETAQMSKSEIYFSNEKVKQELNYTFAPLADTLDWTCNQIKNKNN
ncbi:SDR family oxidoreductase [Fulvivirga lutea]|uniref:SDR family oxidoreductase n=1 Tax=Fulvivirga lutea TaxID=2810512 RepID=A0A974WL78_9BACT|nr:SDR family oxidoreductase [Fulvivirga lutea]QSE97413.1 SDR family oxidoreductase [Fulvivirga lutea]